MNIVLDVSAAFGMLLRKSAGAEISDIVRQADVVLAPDLYVSEMTNVAWKYQKAGVLSVDEVGRLLTLGIDFVDEFVPGSDLAQEALFEASRLGHPAYDLFYIVVARRNLATLVTLDHRLAEVGRSLGLSTRADRGTG